MATKTYSFWKRNGLSLALIAFLLFSIVGQFLTGHQVYNEELLDLGGEPLDLLQYLTSGHFVSSTFENWESEFLQMGMYILLTVSLRQHGSAESRPMSPEEEHERIDPGPKPWPVRAGGMVRKVYEYSLPIAFGILFVLSFVLHLGGSWQRELAERALKGESPVSWQVYFGETRFWFESFQNWQSEFLAVLAVVILSIWLRAKDSPQSKPVEAPHSQTGT